MKNVFFANEDEANVEHFLLSFKKLSYFLNMLVNNPEVMLINLIDVYKHF